MSPIKGANKPTFKIFFILSTKKIRIKDELIYKLEVYKFYFSFNETIF